jgi:flagellar motor switch protein FliM
MAYLGLQPYDGNAILEITPSLIFPILEILLGGTGKVATDIQREVTEIEQTLMDGLFRIISHDLREAWKNITPIEFEILSVGTEAQFLPTGAPIEAVLAVKIEMRLGESIGSMNIAMPSMVINMMRQKFDHEHSTRKSEVSQEEQGRVLELIKASRVKLDARLPGQQIRVKDLISLQLGDVLAFDFLVDAPVDLVLNGQLQFNGTIVSLGKKRGVYLNGAAIL